MQRQESTGLSPVVLDVNQLVKMCRQLKTVSLESLQPKQNPVEVSKFTEYFISNSIFISFQRLQDENFSISKQNDLIGQLFFLIVTWYRFNETDFEIYKFKGRELFFEWLYVCVQPTSLSSYFCKALCYCLMFFSTVPSQTIFEGQMKDNMILFKEKSFKEIKREDK